MRDILADFAARQRSQRFAWGVSDCCLFAADWVQAVAGFDPAAGIRGTYADWMGARRTVMRLGGMTAIAARSGWATADTPSMGDLAVLGDRLRVIGVCTGDGWLIKGAAGLTYVHRPIVGQIWRAPWQL